MTERNIFERANGIYEEIRDIRRDFHRHPELGYHETRTAAVIKEKLQEYGVDSLEQPTETSVVAYIKGRKGDGRTVAIRTDIDALPVCEQTNLPFSSENQGVMHACGHDFHAAMMLGNAKLLCEMRDSFCGTVKVIFQHSEDTQPGGAKELVAMGIMDDVDAILGMHVFPDEDPDNFGEVLLKSGPMTTSADLVQVTVNGLGGHSSQPHLLHNPVLAAAQMIVLMQQIQSRYTDANETVILPIAYLRGDSAINIIPDKVEFGGAARTYSNEVRDVIEDQVRKIARGVEEMSGCRIDVDYVRGYAPVINDRELTETARKAVAKALGEDKAVYVEKPMNFSEDFSAYADVSGKPCTFMLVKAGNAGHFAPLHNGTNTINEKVIPYGMTAMVAAALEYLDENCGC